MLIFVFSRPLDGRQFFPFGRTAQKATIVICQNPDANDKNQLPLVGSLSEGGHLFAEEMSTTDSEKLWRAMYIASKMIIVSEESMRAAVFLAGNEPISDKIAHEAKKCLLYDYKTAQAVRNDAFSQAIPHDEIEVIASVLGLEVRRPSIHPKREMSRGLRSQLAFLKHLSEQRSNAPGNRVAA